MPATQVRMPPIQPFLRDGLPPDLQFVGHAIVSADGMISDAAGGMPPELRNEADFRLFQAALDRSALVVLGRLGHARHPNPGRRRLVVTSGVAGLAPDPADPRAMLYNPAGTPLATALAKLGIASGIIAVTGGTRVFGAFLPLYESFELAEINGFLLPGGRPCFASGHPRAVLAGAGLVPAEFSLIDPEKGVSLTRWQKS
jgi:hypothetical protein